jgi:hypothetical protein
LGGNSADFSGFPPFLGGEMGFFEVFRRGKMAESDWRILPLETPASPSRCP